MSEHATAPTNVPGLLSDAAKAADAHEWDHAADLLKNCPQRVDVLDKRAFYLSRAKRYDEARDVLSALREMEPKNFLWQHMTGYQYYEEQRFGEAIPWFLGAYRLNRNHIRNLYRLAQCRRHEGDADKAALGFGQVLKLWHSLPPEGRDRDAKTMAKASYQLGKHQAQSDPHGAIALLEQAAEHDPDDHDKHYMLGKTYRRVGQQEAGLRELQLAQRLKPGRPYIELELAAALGAAGSVDDAAQLFTRATRNLKGWQAWKAARVALDLARPGDARRLLDIATRSGEVRSSPLCDELKARIDVEAPATRNPPAAAERHRQRGGQQDHRGRRRPRPGAASTGKVHHIRADQGFGFLVDDADHERCYFKLSQNQQLSPGQAVSFARFTTERGPAARDVKATAQVNDA